MLAIYVLTMLLPLHQAAGLQGDLDVIGYTTIPAWSLCSQSQSPQGDFPAGANAIKCPAAGAAKSPMAATLPPAIGLAIFGLRAEGLLPHYQTLGSARMIDHWRRQRAPPPLA